MSWINVAIVAGGVFFILAIAAVIIVERGGWPGPMWMASVAACFLVIMVARLADSVGT